jgi:glycosyltransferase involved in cell wall biosynthesis
MNRRILISGGLSGGGVATHVEMLCRLLLKEGAEVSVCATHSEWQTEAVDELRQSGVEVFLPRFGSIQAVLTWPFTMRRRFAVCYCIGHGRIHDLAKQFLRRTGVSIYHEILVCPRPDSLMSRSMPRMDYIVANSEAVGFEMRKRWPDKSIRVIPFLTSGERITEPQPHTPVARRELRVVYLGRIVSHKRPQKLVEEWKTLTRRAPLAPARLDLYGDDNDPNTVPRLRKLISEQGLEQGVCCHGGYRHDALQDILSKADLVVLPSEWEGLPLVLVEAMQRGVPVVATGVGGTTELGKNNVDVIITGWEWAEFVNGLERMAAKLRAGEIDAVRLHHWTEARYGFDAVAPPWRQALLNTTSFFSSSVHS